MIIRLGHVCFRTCNFSAMVAFYRDTLELPVQFEFGRPDGRPYGMYFAFGSTTFLELFDEEGAADSLGTAPVDRKPIPESTYRHFCLQVSDLADLRNRLLSKGVNVTDIRKGKSEALISWIADPDGNAIELMEYTEESLQLKPPAP